MPAEFVVSYDTVIVCLAGMIASHSICQYVVAVPKLHVIEDCDAVSVRYSAAFELPDPATVFTRELAVPPIVPAVSVTEVYPPNNEKTKSVSASVETDPTDGLDAVALHALAAAGKPVAGSNGVVVSAPDTPKEIPEAEIGVVERVTVIVSDVTIVAAIPYHSVSIDF